MKKLLLTFASFFLTAILVFGTTGCFETLPPENPDDSGSQDQGAPEPYTEGLAFTELSDGTYAVSRGTATAAEIVIPSTYNGKAVTEIAAEGFNEVELSETESNVIKKVTLPNTVKKINRAAFSCCMLLEEINIPEGVTEIGMGAFLNCHVLGDVTLPSTLTVIGENAFMWCNSFKNIVVPNGVTLLSKKAFNGCSALESVTLPSGLAEIDERAFYKCTALKTINFCGTKAQWDNLPKGSYWNFQVTDCTVVYNYTENN